MRITFPAILLASLALTLIGVEAHAFRGNSGAPGFIGRTIEVRDAFWTETLHSDLDFASTVAGAMDGKTKAIKAPEHPQPNTDAQEKLRVHDRLAIDLGQAGQDLADEAEQMILALATLPGRGENRMKREDGGAELACLAEAIYFEARGESIDGQIAVGEVILNRAESPAFPDTVCKVVAQGSQNLNACQFSYKCDGKPEVMNDRESLRRAKDIAILLMKGERRAVSNNATHYHADYVSPGWSKSLAKTTSVGSHIFYRHDL